MSHLLEYVAAGFIGTLAILIVYMILVGKIDLAHLLSEANGSASMSRFQLLIFTFIVAISLFYLVEKRTDSSFPEIPSGVLTLLGISASTYAVGKGISYSREEGVTTPEERQRAHQDVRAVAERGGSAIATPAGMAAEGAPKPQEPKQP
jgi:hypothetical protein